MKFSLKRLLDILLISIVFIITIPLNVLIVMWILIEDGRPIFYTQNRLGLGFQQFRMIKFRTMKIQGVRSNNYFMNYKDDQRLLLIGKLIRGLGLDELPQMINILAGEMSIVGPRPHLLDEARANFPLPYNYFNRFSVKPGVTGLAQVKGRSHLTFHEKIEYDNNYVKHYEKFGLFYDLFLLILTPFRILDLTSHHDKEIS